MYGLYRQYEQEGYEYLLLYVYNSAGVAKTEHARAGQGDRSEKYTGDHPVIRTLYGICIYMAHVRSDRSRNAML